VQHLTASASSLCGLRAAVSGALLLPLCTCSNDAFDADTGVDQSKPESVVNLTGNRPAVLLLSKAFLAAGVGVLSWGISSAADPAVAPLLGAAICCGYLYQGPPFRCVCVWGGGAQHGVGWSSC
jgi:1,4-dihydroxy-2-naphthoate octaprenyltransferase